MILVLVEAVILGLAAGLRTLQSCKTTIMIGISLALPKCDTYNTVANFYNNAFLEQELGSQS